jgi:quercetin dioxygenase-like cupin family protein
MQAKHLKRIEAFKEGKMSKVNLFETERFFCDIYCLLPGQSQRPHSHAKSDKVYVVLRGQVEASVGGESRPLGEGEAVLAPAGEPHGIENRSGAEAVCLVFMAPHPDHAG